MVIILLQLVLNLTSTIHDLMLNPNQRNIEQAWCDDQGKVIVLNLQRENHLFIKQMLTIVHVL